jgi:hypothetical protein
LDQFESKEADNFTKVKTVEILLGSTGFVAVTDVVRMAHELMESEIKNERFTLIAEMVFFRDILNAMADALDVKRFMQNLFYGNTLEIGLVCFECFSTKRKLSQAKILGNLFKSED